MSNADVVQVSGHTAQRRVPVALQIHAAVTPGSRAYIVKSSAPWKLTQGIATAVVGLIGPNSRPDFSIYLFSHTSMVHISYADRYVCV